MSRKREIDPKGSKLLLIAVIAGILVIPITACSGEAGETDPSVPAMSQTQQTQSQDTHAEEIGQSKWLGLSSVYTSSILNPDCGDAYAEEIASLEVTNNSENYLLFARLIGQMSDGTTVVFQLHDIPAGQTAEVFDSKNQSLEAGVTCLTITCEAEEYLPGTASVDGVTIENSNGSAVITNSTGKALADLKVVYHCDMGGLHFGGISYEMTIKSLSPGESLVIEADTLFGTLAVVRIYQ